MSGLSLLSTNKNSATFRPGYAPSDTLDVAGAAFTNVRQNFNFDSEIRLVGDPLHKRNALIQERFGQSVSDLTGTSKKYTNPTADGRIEQLKEDNDQIDAIILRGRKEQPGRWDGIKTTAEIRDEGKRIADDATKNAEQVTARNPSQLSSISGQLVGGVGGAFTDPVNIATLPLGAGETKIVGTGAFATAKAIALTAAKEGAIQAAVQAASVPQVAHWQNTVGHKYGLSEAATDIGLGFVGGTAIRGGTEALIPAVRGIYKGANHVSAYALDTIAAKAPNVSQSVKDALQYMSRTAYVDEAAPLPLKDVKDLKAHREVTQKVADDLNQYKRPSPELPGVTKIITPRNELELEVKSRLVDLADLVTSDKSGFDQSLQPRDRTNRMASDVRINEIAARLDPAQLGDSRVSNTGSPIVGPDMMVESGNGRVMALRKAYEAHPERAQAYRDFIESQGFDTTGMQQPVLIRQRVSELTPEQRKNFVIYSNEDVADRLSTTERAMADAKLMTKDMIANYKGGDVMHMVNDKFVRSFVDKAISPAERNSFLTPDGKISQDGARRLRGAMLAKAYNDSNIVQRLLEDQDNDIKTIGAVLTDIAPAWSKIKMGIEDGEIPPIYDITRDLMDAVKTIIHARETGRPITDFVNQRGLFAETDLTAETNAILTGLYKKDFVRPEGFDNAKAFLTGYVSEVEKTSTGENLFNEKPVDPVDILTSSSKKMKGKENLALSFDKEKSPEISALRDLGVYDLAKNTTSPIHGGLSYLKALDEFSKRPTTISTVDIKSPERAALHKKIMRKIMKKPEGGFGKDRIFEIVLGPPGSGKSSVVASELLSKLKALELDSDLVKAELPEFDKGLGANAVHEESKIVADEIMAAAIEKGINIVHPIVGANPEKVGALVDKMNKAGYTVNVRLVEISEAESMRRNVIRYEKTGRLLPPSYIAGIKDGPLRSYEAMKARGDINVHSYFDNAVKEGEKPRIVESNDPQYISNYNAAGEKSGSGLQGTQGVRSLEGSGPLDPERVNALFDDNAYRLREYRETPIIPPSEINPSERLAANQARFAALLKDNPDMMVTADDGSTIRLADYAARMKEDEKVIEALTTCMVA